MCIKLIPPVVLAESRVEAGWMMAAGKPVNWVAAGVIVAVWVLLAVGGVLLVLRLMR